MHEPVYTAHHVLRNARIALGITQRDVANQIGLSNTAISNMETGYQPLTYAPTIDDLARVLKIDPIDLYAAANVLPPDFDKQIRSLTGEELRKVIRRVDTILSKRS